MTRVLGFMLAALLLLPVCAGAGELTLRDVMELRRSGMGDDLLIAVIESDGGPFQLSFADIQDLKSDGVSERIIEALVRTGARQIATAEPELPASPVVEEVVTFVPAVVMVAVPVVPVWGHDDRAGHHQRTNDHRHPSTTPPATWVTRQEDGKNVPASGPVRSSVPPATWVTPRDPQPRESQPPEKPRPR
jgi:hypothetical protein